jgi:hypothetical protein
MVMLILMKGGTKDMKIEFDLKSLYNNVKEGRINPLSLMAKPLKAEIIEISDDEKVIHVKTEKGSFFDLTEEDYIIWA